MRRLSLLAVLAVLSMLSIGLLGFGVATETDVLPPGGLAAEEQPPSIDPGSLAPATGMRFGIDAKSVDQFAERAGAPDYATVWVGKWNQDRGWRDTDAAIQALRDKGVTPAIHFYYWGDDMGRACLWDGCNGKSRDGWQMLAQDLVWHLESDLQGGPVLIVLETEFNKGGVNEDEGLDQLLAEKATFLKANYPAAQVVLGLGNWWPQSWATWDQAAAASDYVGLQALVGSTRDAPEEFDRLADATLDGVLRLRELFGKPVVVQDVAVSSYPEPDNLGAQANAMAKFAETLPALRDAGVEAVIYRAFLDAPTMALHNHYAEAERHWGLAWHDTGELKPAGETWMAAIQKAREPPVPPARVANGSDVPPV
jgi:hypothetical protein